MYPKFLHLKIYVQIMLPFIFLNIPLWRHWFRWIALVVPIVLALIAITAM